jgi:hypothetical protein
VLLVSQENDNSSGDMNLLFKLKQSTLQWNAGALQLNQGYGVFSCSEYGLFEDIQLSDCSVKY